MGGIEAFATDLLLSFRARSIPVELICWNAATHGKNPALSELSRAGVNVHCSDWRWGCRWGWPDRMQTHRCWNRMLNADILVFGKLLHDSVHRQLLSHRKRMVLITPYRPAEMWEGRCPDNAILNSFESIVVQTPAFAEDLRGYGYKGHVLTLPYIPPDVHPISPLPLSPPVRIGFLGRLVPDKNLDYLILSLSILRENGSSAQLHFFGDGPLRKHLQVSADRMHVAEHVQFHERQERFEVSAAIDSCHMFAFTSTTEGQCLAALEILARGRPVVASPVGAFPEILSDSRLGAVAPLNDPKAFALVLQEVTRRILEGEILPIDIQDVYVKHFPRWQVIDEYVRELGCSSCVQEMMPTS